MELEFKIMQNLSSHFQRLLDEFGLGLGLGA